MIGSVVSDLCNTGLQHETENLATRRKSRNKKEEGRTLPPFLFPRREQIGKNVIYFFLILSAVFVEGVHVNRFHDVIGSPAAALFDVGVRNLRCVCNGDEGVTEIVKAEMFYSGFPEELREGRRNIIHGAVADVSLFPYFFYDGIRQFDIPVGLVCFRTLFDDSLVLVGSVGPLDVEHAVAVKVGHFKGDDLSTAERAKSAKENGDFKLGSFGSLKKTLHIIFFGNGVMRLYFLRQSAKGSSTRLALKTPERKS